MFKKHGLHVIFIDLTLRECTNFAVLLGEYEIH